MLEVAKKPFFEKLTKFLLTPLLLTTQHYFHTLLPILTLSSLNSLQNLFPQRLRNGIASSPPLPNDTAEPMETQMQDSWTFSFLLPHFEKHNSGAMRQWRVTMRNCCLLLLLLCVMLGWAKRFSAAPAQEKREGLRAPFRLLRRIAESAGAGRRKARKVLFDVHCEIAVWLFFVCGSRRSIWSRVVLVGLIWSCFALIGWKLIVFLFVLLV